MAFMSRATLNLRVGAVIAAAVVAAGCTLKKQETPSLTGPSELGTAIDISVSPDVLTQDGASQSFVSITARDSNGQPIRNLSLRADTAVGGVTTDFGSLSARNLVTDATGRASLVFTAPPAVFGAPATDVQIVVRPTESDFGNSTPRSATIHLVPSGTVVPPRGSVTAKIIVTPPAPLDHQTVLFDGSQSTSTTGTVVQWQWDFGDGGRATGMTASHSFDASGNFNVRLTAIDNVGASDTVSVNVPVGQGSNPSASFVVSPASPVINQQVNFNASASTATTGRVIQSYSWDFGDGHSGSGVTTTHAFANAGTFTVVLVVTDDAGHVGTSTQSVTVSNGNPTAQITVSPPSGTVGQQISFIGSQSTAAPGRTITNYHWDFGDGSSGSGATTSHGYGAAGTYTVTLIVTDDQGKQGIATAQVTIQ
jgi:PKD repeat protein